MGKRFKIAIAAAIILICCIGLTACARPAAIPAEELAVLENDAAPKAEGSLRVMSANVLVHIKSWGGEPVLSRADRFARAVKHYKPDVIAAQEFSSQWYSKLMPMLKDEGYTVIEEKYTAFVENRTPIIYDSDFLALVDHGIKKFSEGDDNGCRVVSYAVFDGKSDAKRFAVASTHFDLIRKDREDEELAIMKKQADELFAVVDFVSNEYGCPVIICGDFNSMERASLKTDYYGECDEIYAASEVYGKIASKYSDAKYAEGITKYDVGGGILPDGAWSSPTWDHIFIKGAARVKAFAVLSSVYFQRYADGGNRVSDHLPIFADVSI